MSIFNDKSIKSVADIAAQIMGEALKGDQHKIDKNKNNKIDAHDFAILRGEKKAMKKEEVNQIEEGKMKELHMDLKDMSHDEFQKQYGKPKSHFTNKPTVPSGDIKAKVAATRAKLAAMRKEEVELEEGWDDMMKATKERQGPQPSGAAGVKKGVRYGGSRQKDEPEVAEKPKKKKLKESFTEMLEKYDAEGLKVFVSLQEEPDNEQFTKELKDQEASMMGKKKQPAVASPATQGVKQMPEEVEVLDADKINGTTVNTIEERSLTEPEAKKKEEIVKSMKKKMPGFKERYGERAKSVMYATATKMAKGD